MLLSIKIWTDFFIFEAWNDFTNFFRVKNKTKKCYITVLTHPLKIKMFWFKLFSNTLNWYKQIFSQNRLQMRTFKSDVFNYTDYFKRQIKKIKNSQLVYHDGYSQHQYWVIQIPPYSHKLLGLAWWLCEVELSDRLDPLQKQRQRRTL